MQVDWVLGLELLATAVFAAVAGLLALAALQARGAASRGAIFTETAGGTTFLFDGETLVDATPGARALLAQSHGKGSPWARLLAVLGPRFPAFETRLGALSGEGRIALASVDSGQAPLMLRAELRGGLTRITLLDPEAETNPPGADPLTQRVIEEELAQLRSTVTQAPMMIWREAAGGDVVWANSAYLLQAARSLDPGQDLGWPLPRLFERTASAQGASGQRQRLEQPGGGAVWFDLISYPDGEGRLVFGLPADAAVQAEGHLRDFMQTLTKTFAHLPIGLAIFDNQRQLALFNPALIDLTGLPPDFLSLRPTLFAVLDAMRDRNMIPEPKDYRGWRKQMNELEKAASSGTYEETWSLPSGQTYRVIGRPHPNGALAMMFEDISNEMSRTRRYRADLELGQAVIDAMDDAIAVFSQAGLLVMSNAAYATLWGHDPAAGLGDGAIATLAAHWRDNSAPSPIWSEAERFVATLGERAAWGGDARLADGRLVSCRFSALAGGASLVTFRPAAPVEGTAPAFATARAVRRSA
ncbi:PAS-domain containing protein [Paracoccaceae bacterium Fryx2]|nr:PAS-domain containing protein [Paracoccaceae bacterium Fryx2]